MQVRGFPQFPARVSMRHAHPRSNRRTVVVCSRKQVEHAPTECFPGGVQPTEDGLAACHFPFDIPFECGACSAYVSREIPKIAGAFFAHVGRISRAKGARGQELFAILAASLLSEEGQREPRRDAIGQQLGNT